MPIRKIAWSTSWWFLCETHIELIKYSLQQPYLRKFGGHVSFRGTTETSVYNDGGISLDLKTTRNFMWYMFSDIYLWCDTYQALGGLHAACHTLMLAVFQFAARQLFLPVMGTNYPSPFLNSAFLFSCWIARAQLCYQIWARRFFEGIGKQICTPSRALKANQFVGFDTLNTCIFRCNSNICIPVSCLQPWTRHLPIRMGDAMNKIHDKLSFYLKWRTENPLKVFNVIWGHQTKVKRNTLGLIANFCFLFKVFGGHICPFLGPLFWISGDVSSGFQSQSGFCLIRIVEANVMYIPQRSTSGATRANLLAASLPPGPVPMYCCRGEVARIRTCAVRISASQMLYQFELNQDGTGTGTGTDRWLKNERQMTVKSPVQEIKTLWSDFVPLWPNIMRLLHVELRNSIKVVTGNRLEWDKRMSSRFWSSYECLENYYSHHGWKLVWMRLFMKCVTGTLFYGHIHESCFEATGTLFLISGFLGVLKYLILFVYRSTLLM